MRLVSTKESFGKGEVSFLAVAETLAAISIALLVAMKLGTFKWLALSVCLAPLLLLRMPESIRLGATLAKRFMGSLGWLRSLSEHLQMALWVPFALRLAIAGLLVRLLSTLVTTVRHPFVSVGAIPGNWCRVRMQKPNCCLCRTQSLLLFQAGYYGCRESAHLPSIFRIGLNDLLVTGKQWILFQIGVPAVTTASRT